MPRARHHVLIVLATAYACACAGSPQVRRERAARNNQRALDDALDRVRRDRSLEPLTPSSVAAFLPGSEEMIPPAPPGEPEAPVAIHLAGGGQHGLLDGELLVAVPATTPGEPEQLAFLSDLCLGDDSSCGCSLSASYHFFRRDDGHVVIARLHPVLHITEVHVESCGYGCGREQPGPSPYQPRSMVALGAIPLDMVEVLDLSYDLEAVVETCDNPMPYP